jgi:hypothetical protein
MPYNKNFKRDNGVPPFRDVYEKFRATCWAPEPYIDLEPVFCFNSSLTFSG